MFKRWRPGRAAGLLVAFSLATVSLTARALPSFQETRAAYTPSDALLLARDGRPLHSLRVDKTVRRLAWTPLAEISPALVRAVIVSEDKRFLAHDGVDWQAAGKAAWSNFWGGKTRGASTLTMQLAGLLDEEDQRRGRRSLFEKLTQTAAALNLERSWRKPQILEAYLNLVSFRGEAQGISAMSRQLFGKWPHGLNERESALAAALLRAPNAPASLVSQRACRLLKEMARPDECEGLEGFATLALGGGYRQSEAQAGGAPQLAPHLARKLLTQAGQTLTATLDADLQAYAREALRRHLAALNRQNVEDGAVVVIDNARGDILAWVGSSGDLSGAAEVDGVVALRQAGSTLKPFLYAQAFERRQLTPASLIEDAALTVDGGSGLYAPQNYEPHYRGWVSARMALGGSLNVPAVKTLIRLTPETFVQALRRNGFASLKESGDWYGYSLALGSADVSLLMLANAYRSLANGGQWSPLRATLGAPPAAALKPAPDKASRASFCTREGCNGVFDGVPRAAHSPASAWLVSHILADKAARAGTFGLESWLATPYWSAAKTGTSKDMRDNWCIGYSRRYTVAVWVGNASGQPMHNVSGVSGAAPVWREVMDWLHRSGQGHPRVESRAPTPPAGITGRPIHFEPPREPPRQEWFLSGTETTVVKAADSRALARIAYPSDGSLLALDPDIPPSRQRIPLRLTTAAEKSWQWRLDQQLLGKVSATPRWLPQPGKHRLTLETDQGELLDQVRFEVRALKGKRAP